MNYTQRSSGVWTPPDSEDDKENRGNDNLNEALVKQLQPNTAIRMEITGASGTQKHATRNTRRRSLSNFGRRFGTDKRSRSVTSKFTNAVPSQMTAGVMGQLPDDFSTKGTRHMTYSDSESEDSKENHDNDLKEVSAEKLQWIEKLHMDSKVMFKKIIEYVEKESDRRKEIETEVRAESELYIKKLKQRNAELENKVRFLESNQAKVESTTGANVQQQQQSFRMSSKPICDQLPLLIDNADKSVLKNCRPNVSHVVEDVQIASGQVLFPPAITYDSNEQDSEEHILGGNTRWKIPYNRRFLFPAQFPQIWVAVIFENWDGNIIVDNFIDAFVDTAQRRGMRASRPIRYEMCKSMDVKYIREKFEYYKKNEAKYVMFFTKSELDPVHHIMKLMEVKFGIVTQNISEKTLKIVLEKRYGFTAINSIVMKSNLKLGGINHCLCTSNAMLNANRFTHDVVKQEWLREYRMFIGLDMNHVPRQMEEKSIEPTIVSMAYTIGHPLKMRGTYWTQQPQERTIQPTQFVTNLVSALQTYHSEVRQFPQHIMVFRGEVSKDEYQKVATVEFGAFEAAFKALEQKHRDFQPPSVTIIVIERQSKYRIVPAQVENQGRPGVQNVCAGTVLVANHAHQGTPCPSRYTVVVDTCSPRIPLKELEYVSHHLCYAQGIECSPTSVPALLMAAADLKKRGRNNWKVANFGDDPSSDAVRFNGDGSEQFFTDMSNALKPIIPTKFWA